MNLRTEPRKFLFQEGAEPLAGFTIQRGVGVGGFGEVYYATTRAGKDVALKRVNRNFDIELRGVQQCLNLRHPNLIELYDIRYDEQETPWVVMEFVGGDSLRDVVGRNPQGMSESVARHWFKGIAAGVAYLHDHDVVHRDLKPGNVFLDNGIVKIGDYGLAKLISSNRMSGNTESVGTFRYMAPEIGRGKYGRRVDIYALGILLYEMLAGRVPFEGESTQEIIMKHLTAKPDVDVIDPPYRQVVSRALSKDPDRRYSTVDGMLADLDLEPSYYQAAPGRSLAARPDEVMDATTVDDADGAGGVVQAELLREVPDEGLGGEPIARNVLRMLQGLRQRWELRDLGTFSKFVLISVAVVMFVVNAAWIVPLAFFLGTIYAGYLLIWMLLLPVQTTKSSALMQLDSTQAGMTPATNDPAVLANRQRALRQRYMLGKIELSRDIFAERPASIRAQELVGSLLLSSVVVGVVTLLSTIGTMLLTSVDDNSSIYVVLPRYAWMATTSLLGTWSLLGIAKMFEGHEGDPVLRRFTMLVTGLGLGVVSTMLASWFYYEPTYMLSLDWRPAGHSDLLYRADGAPKLLAAMGYFGGLMLLLRWWQLADPLRSTRLSMLTTVGCVLTAILVHFVLPYPRGFVIAATMAIAVQIAAPWLNPDQRQRLVELGAPLRSTQ